MNSDITRISIPNFGSPVLPNQDNPAAKIVDENTNRIDGIQQAIGDAENGSTPAAAATAAASTLQSASSKPSKLDGLIDSILAKFPLNQPVTLSFIGCKTDAETDKVTADVARRLAERRVGKVLLVDASPNSQMLSSELGLGNSEGIGNVLCDDQPWESLLQSGYTDGLDFLPYGNINTAKTLRSNTQKFLVDAKLSYQFICVSAGLNEKPLSKSFCNAADGIYLLVDLVQLTHLEAKAAADQLMSKNLPLVGCIALDAELDQQ